jgi:hypothetical protein
MRLALAVALAATLAAPGIAGAQPLNWRCDRQAFTTHCYGPDPVTGQTWQSHTQHNTDGSTSTEIVPPMHAYPRWPRWGG